MPTFVDAPTLSCVALQALMWHQLVTPGWDLEGLEEQKSLTKSKHCSLQEIKSDETEEVQTTYSHFLPKIIISILAKDVSCFHGKVLLPCLPPCVLLGILETFYLVSFSAAKCPAAFLSYFFFFDSHETLTNTKIKMNKASGLSRAIN